jgi:dihydrodipicolinate synthase/N-acetylneuraminate lyase
VTAVTWRGVMAALTTEFTAGGSIDHGFVAEHCRRLIDAGCTGLVPSGSLGEGATLAVEEKLALLRTAVAAVGDRVPVIPGIAAASTDEAVRWARAAAATGAAGLMVLPPLGYPADWREVKAHVAAVLDATDLPAMLYNNPAAYGTDFLPEQVAELAAEHPNLAAVKESSGDARRITAIRALTGDRVALLAGLDDGVVEGVMAGAGGWIAGLANALPREAVRLFDLALAVREGRAPRADLDALYAWFLPLLRLDAVPKFVQLIKLVQQECGIGSARVRPPRLPLAGSELAAALGLIRAALAQRPAA